MIEEIQEMAEMPPIEPQAAAAETLEEREARLKREDYQRRNLEAMDEYERITGQIHPSRHAPEAALRQRCCF